MTDGDLATMLRRHVEQTEPSVGPLPAVAISRGRRRLRRRRWALAASTAAVVGASAAIAALAVPNGDGAGKVGTDISPATSAALAHYNAARMPALLRSHTRSALGAALPPDEAGTFEAGDGQGEALPRRLWDKASTMSLAFTGPGHRYQVVLAHSRSEAEGNVSQICASDVAEGTYLACDVRRTPTGELATVRISALRPMGAGDMAIITRRELRTGKPTPGDPLGTPIDPSKIWFEREVTVVHSDTFLTSVSEDVKAPNQEAAAKMLRLRVADMTALASDPELVIPEPPTDKGGCPWTLPSAHVTCAG